MEPAHMKRLE